MRFFVTLAFYAFVLRIYMNSDENDDDHDGDNVCGKLDICSYSSIRGTKIIKSLSQYQSLFLAFGKYQQSTLCLLYYWSHIWLHSNNANWQRALELRPSPRYGANRLQWVTSWRSRADGIHSDLPRDYDRSHWKTHWCQSLVTSPCDQWLPSTAHKTKCSAVRKTTRSHGRWLFSLVTMVGRKPSKKTLRISNPHEQCRKIIWNHFQTARTKQMAADCNKMHSESGIC